jgi:hypothetical protein
MTDTKELTADMTPEELKATLSRNWPRVAYKGDRLLQYGGDTRVDDDMYRELVKLIEDSTIIKSAKALKTGEGILTREEVFAEQQKEDRVIRNRPEEYITRTDIVQHGGLDNAKKAKDSEAKGVDIGHLLMFISNLQTKLGVWWRKSQGGLEFKYLEEVYQILLKYHKGELLSPKGKHRQDKPRQPVVDDYEIRKGSDGEWGIFLREYNVRVASFFNGTAQDRERIKQLLQQKPQVSREWFDRLAWTDLPTKEKIKMLKDELGVEVEK